MSQWQQTVIEQARAEARQLRHPYIRSEHLLLAVLRLIPTVEGMTYEDLLAQVMTLPTPACGAEQQLTLARGAERALAATASDTPVALAQALLASSPVLQRLIANEKGGTHAP